MTKIYFIFVILAICLWEIHALEIAENEVAEIIVSMKGGVEGIHENLRARTYINREDRLNAVYGALTKNRDASQQPLLDYLVSRNVKHDSLWISNQVFIPNCNADLLNQIKKFPGVSDVQRNEYFQLEKPIVGENEPSIQAEWGINKIEAPKAWEIVDCANCTGEGAVVCVIDSGVRGTHEALKDNYVGNDKFGWKDPYDNTTNPNDGNGHGTHCTGTIVGNKNSGYGVAPNAKWMACKGCKDGGSCTSPALNKCAEYTICPSSPAACSNAPDIVSNSWAGGPTGWFDPSIQAWKTAGIVVVFAQGNSGPECSSANYPGTSEDVIGVGATTNIDELASFSSRGPVVGTSRIKPDISAPGQGVKSSYFGSDTDSATFSGTSMACPHVSGVIALMIGANPKLKGKIDEINKILYNSQNCDPVLNSGEACGGNFSNNFGCGRINAFNAVLEAIKYSS